MLGLLIDWVKRVIKSHRYLSGPIVPMVRWWQYRIFRRRMRRFRASCRNIGNRIKHPVFVKVGANDGVTGDPCSDLLLSNDNWSGVLIEPVPACFARLTNTFGADKRFILEQVAVGANVTTEAFYYVDQRAKDADPSLPYWYDQLGSFNRDHIVGHLKGALEPFIRSVSVQVLPLDNILKRNAIETVHLLQIDTEGYDDVVLKTLNFAKHLPELILVEHSHLPDGRKSAMREFLRSHGYAVEDGGNDYVARRTTG